MISLALAFCLVRRYFKSRMICEDYDVRPYQVCTKFVQGIDHCQQLFLCGGVIPLCLIQRFACIVDHIRSSFFSLPENCSNGEVACIAYNLERKLPIGGSHYWCSGQVRLELLKALLEIFIPNEFDIILQ